MIEVFGENQFYGEISESINCNAPKALVSNTHAR